MNTSIYLISCATLLIGAVYMIFASCYQDGVFGKVSLGIVALGAGSAIIKMFDGTCAVIPPHAVAIAAGSGLFMIRHLIRFWKSVYRKREAA